MKEYLTHIVRANGYSSVDDFMKSYRNAKADYADYTRRLKAWGDKYGMKYVEQQFAKQHNAYGFSHEQIQRGIKPQLLHNAGYAKK